MTRNKKPSAYSPERLRGLKPHQKLWESRHLPKAGHPSTGS